MSETKVAQLNHINNNLGTGDDGQVPDGSDWCVGGRMRQRTASGEAAELAGKDEVKLADVKACVRI